MTPWQQAIHNIAIAPLPEYNRCRFCGDVIPDKTIYNKPRKYCSPLCLTNHSDQKKREAKRNARLANCSR